MTAQQKRLIRETFPVLLEMAGPLSQLFYGRLFQLDPSVRTMFRGDIRAQGRKLMDMLATLVDNIDHLESQLPALRALGQRHAGYGVKTEHYETLQTALSLAWGQALHLEFTGDVKTSWLALIEEVNTEMKAGAAELSQLSHST